MTAAAADLMKSAKGVTEIKLPLAPSKTAYKGATAMAVPSAGYVRPGVTGATTAGANDLFLGVFEEQVTNSSTTATTPVNVNLLKEYTMLYRINDGSISSSTLFNPCYVVDDTSVSATSTNRAIAGLVIEIDTPNNLVGFIVKAVY